MPRKDNSSIYPAVVHNQLYCRDYGRETPSQCTVNKIVTVIYHERHSKFVFREPHDLSVVPTSHHCQLFQLTYLKLTRALDCELYLIHLLQIFKFKKVNATALNLLYYDESAVSRPHDWHH